jgi:HAD superfamily hydrolase (TIGR01509 family)
MNTIQGVLLDIDGTLVDSNDAHAHSWVEAFSEFGREIPFEKIRPLIGMGGDKLMERVARMRTGEPEARVIMDRRQEIFMTRYVSTLTAFPGAKELLRHMHDKGLRLVAASSAKKRELDALLKICGADKVIDAKVSADDVDNSKPDPDIVKAALDKASLRPDEAMMLGDTPYDIEAASKAGIKVIALRCGGRSDEDLKGAAAIYDGPADLLAKYDSSPLDVAARR